MQGFRTEHIANDIRLHTTDIIRKLKDPRISELISITHVTVTNDLSYATIYISCVNGLNVAKESCKGLKSASGYVRRELAGRLDIRKMPELKFIPDDSIESGNEIIKKINKLTYNNEDNNDR